MIDGKKLKKFSRFLLRICFSTAVGLVVLELLLRLIPMKATDFNSTFQFMPDSTVGYLPAHDQDDAYNTQCVRNPHVQTNSLGLRGPEWGKQGSPTIALLGDSFILGLDMPEKMHIATLLGASTQGEVWNGGVSGYGTYQALLLWRKLIRARKPELTLLFTFLENDVWDNHCGLCRPGGQINSPCWERKNGELSPRIDFQKDGDSKSWAKAWLIKNCRSCRIVNQWRRGGRHEPAAGNIFDQQSHPYNVYRRQAGPIWEEAWSVYAWSLNSLKRECDSLGTKLLVVNIPGVIQMAKLGGDALPDGLTVGQLPVDFDFDYPSSRLDAITSAAGIESIHLAPGFSAYRDRHQLASPGFQWCCDAHWNPLGHRIAADLVYNELARLGWIEARSMDDTPSPSEVLGEELMRAIYGCETVWFE